jgi:transcriptional regulator with XRE-family HTH domain
MSQADFAKRIGVQRNTVVRWEAGRFIARPDSIAALIKFARTDRARRRLQSTLSLPMSEIAPIMPLRLSSDAARPAIAEPGACSGARLSGGLERPDA